MPGQEYCFSLFIWGPKKLSVLHGTQGKKGHCHKSELCLAKPQAAHETNTFDKMGAMVSPWIL